MLKKALLSIPLLAIQLQTMAVSVSISGTEFALCAYPSGELTANASGGVGPYSYLWSNGATTESIQGLTAGTYSITVTDANLEEATAEAEIVSVGYGHAPNPWEFYFYQFAVEPFCTNAWPFATFFRVNPNWGNSFFGPPPYYQDGIELGQESGGDPDVYYGIIPTPPGQDYTFTFSDANGCSGTITVPGVQPIDWPSFVVMDVEGSCTTMPSGSITFAHGAEGFGRMVTYELTGMQGQGTEVLPGMEWYGNASGTQVINGLLPGLYRLRQRTGGLYNGSCYDEHLIEVPDNGPDCGRVTGRAFMDHNLSCTRQGSEPYVPSGIVEVLPGPYYASTDAVGSYSIVLPTGSYTLEQQSNSLDEHCTGGPIPFTITAGQTATVNLPDTSAVSMDVQLTLSGGIARPGFDLQYGISARNLTPAASGSTSLSFTFDPTLGYLSATPTPTSVVGNVITWNQAQLTAWQQRNYTIRFQVPPDIGLLGYELQATAIVGTANTDGDLSNNTATNLRTITGAYDPNDKLAYTSSGSTNAWQIGSDEWIDYTIRFQNTGTDTAFHVVITDTLPTNLDPSSITMGAGSHAFSWDLRDAGTLKFYFTSILLPDSNVNEPASHGFVSFRIKPREPVLPGTSFENIANIYFDFNPPVITPPSVLTVSSPGVAVSPRVMLGGPYVQATQLMSDALRSSGLIPLTEQYTALGYAHVNGGGETTSAPVLAVTGDNAIVDWVVVELRSTTAPYGVLATRSALVQRDGDVVSTTGSGPVLFNMAAGNYRVAIRHRNHLGAMTNTSRALSTTTTTVDFSVATTATYGTNAQATVGTRRVLWAGDCQSDGELKYTGDDNDRDLILQEIGGVAPTATSTGYVREDVNMDGVVKYTGANNDRDRILVNIGGTVPTNVLHEQLP
jgi:uncharacterized repeat protein (TIGR01451 family)